MKVFGPGSQACGHGLLYLKVVCVLHVGFTAASELALAEVSRLQHSLLHLKRTQDELRDHISTSETIDHVVQEAIEENDGVIASQEERIGMLKLALQQKGVNIQSGHYDTASSIVPSAPPEESTPVGSQSVNAVDERDEGVYL